MEDPGATLVQKDEAEAIFAVMRQIYDTLLRDGNLDKILPQSLKFEELDVHDETYDDYLGMTHFDHITTENNEVLTSINRVSIKIRYNDGKIAEILRLIPTLLHELAHVSTELKRKLDPQFLSRAKKQKQFNKEHFSHDEAFYEDFRRILKAAELLGIYKMPPSIQNQFNSHHLRRFDAVNHLDCPKEFLGSTELFKEKQAVESAPTSGPSPAKPVIIGVKDSRGLSKSIQLDSPDIATLRKLIKAKFRVAPKQINLREGNLPINTDDDVKQHLSQSGVEIVFK